MYIYETQPPGFPVGQAERSVGLRLPQHNSYNFDRTISGFLWNRDNAWANEGLGQLTVDELSKKLNHFSFLPHSVEVNGKDLPLTPAAMDPGIYDGADKYKIAPTLQDCLKTVMAMEKGKFRHIKVALVDLTKNVMRPEFAASFDHKEPVFVASVPKIAAMLAAYQLRHDLRVAWKQKAVKTLDDLFGLVHNDWADTQRDPKTKPTPFTRGVSCLGSPPCRGKLVLAQGQKIALTEPKAPRLKDIFANAVPIEFKSTGENKAKLKSLINEFNQGFEDLDNARKKLAVEKKKGNAIRIAEARKECSAKLQEFEQKKAKLNALGFLERMRVMIGGLVPASNFATSTIIRDVGYLYMASTLLQSGLYDTNRNGGLWLSADYWSGCWTLAGKCWSGPLGRGFAQNATAGSLAAFMTLLAQHRLVSRDASVGMQGLMKKAPNPTHSGTFSPFKQGLKRLPNKGSLKTVLSKIGVAGGGIDDCAYIERDVDCGQDKKRKLTLHYVAVGLRAKNDTELKKLIVELDKCILANNRTTPCVKA
jgi:hypothetical protein